MLNFRKWIGACIGASFVFLGCSTTSEIEKIRGPQYVEDGSFSPQAVRPALTSQHPHLCFDQGHHNLAIRKDRYRPVLGLLESDGFQIRYLENQIQKKELEDCDVLYISAALGFSDLQQRALARRSAFTTDEIQIITDWVKRGGGVFLATDHRPMADAMEPLLQALGIEGSVLSVQAPHPLESFQDRGIFEISGAQLMASHPIIRGRDTSEQIKKLYWFYGGSFRGKKSSTAILKVGKGFEFVDSDDDSKQVSDYPALGVASDLGKGRVIAIGDGTMMTAKLDTISGQKTGINRPGSDNVQFALNAFRWLARLY